MVMFSSTFRGRVYKFGSPTLPPDALQLVRGQGQESISRLFRFDLDLISPLKELDTAAMLQAPASLAIKQGVPISGSKRGGVRTLRYHGVIQSVESGERWMEYVVHRVVFVPRLWRLSTITRSRIFMDKNVPEIAEQVLRDAGFGNDEYEFRLGSRPYPRREYVVQYQESDLDFVSRLLEHEGIFYYFRHEEERERVVFGDGPLAFEPISGEKSLPFREATAPGVASSLPGGPWFREESIGRLRCRHDTLPRDVLLRDYNYRTPGVDLQATAAVVPNGVGHSYEYGDHFKDDGEGKTLARIRAEALRCREKLYLGSSDARAFHAGLTYSLREHSRGDFNRDYLLVEVRHRMEQVLPLGTNVAPQALYANEFVSIPADAPYRPPRVTLKPKAGLINARIDAAGDGKYAEIDDQGRYRVRFPYDASGRGGGTASRYVRMAQPYAGAGMGMHFPLHKGTEVVVGHVNGDPDRPFIVNAVPNPATASVVSNANQRDCVLHSCANNVFTMANDAAGVHLRMESPAHATAIHMGEGPLNQGIRMHTEADHVREIQRHDQAHIGGNITHCVDGTTETTNKGKTSKTFLDDLTQMVMGKVKKIVLNKVTEFISRKLTRFVGGKNVSVTRGSQLLRNQQMLTNSLTANVTKAGQTIEQEAPKIELTGREQVHIQGCAGETLWYSGGVQTMANTFEVMVVDDVKVDANKMISLRGGAVMLSAGSDIFLKATAFNVSGLFLINKTNLIVME